MYNAIKHRMLHSSEYRLMRLLDGQKKSFEELLQNTWGIYPSKLLTILNEFEKQGIIKKNTDDTWELLNKTNIHVPKEHIKDRKTYKDPNHIKKANQKMDEFRRELPVPHPHDFDWRFSVEGLERFAGYLIDNHSSNEKVCVIAAPSIYVYLLFIDYFDHITLIERSYFMVEKIKNYFSVLGVISHDLQYPFHTSATIQKNEFSCIIADPPWYQDYYELFLSRAKEIVSPGGLIHLALFPPFAKKSALRERTAIFSFAQNNGMDLIELKPGLLRYDTPIFERNALEAEKFKVNSKLWRKGDVASFYVSNKTGQDIIIQVETGDWVEFIYHRSKIKLRHKEPVKNYEKPTITSVLSDTQEYPSVSRKYSARDKIDLWTSGNQAYMVSGSYVIKIMIEKLVDNTIKEDIFQNISEDLDISRERVNRECEETYNKLVEILEREKNEHN